MIPFQKAEITDKPWVDTCLGMDNQRGCEFSFTSLFVWGNVYEQRIARIGDRLVANFCGKHGCSYVFPIGGGDPRPALDAMEADAKEREVPFRLVALSKEQVARLEEHFPQGFEVTAEPEHFDYCYDIEKMCTLAGKKLHGKRNHINRFEEAYPQWEFHPITKETLPQCLELDAQWEREALERFGISPTQGVTPERRAILMTSQYYEELGMEGGMIMAEDKVLAFTMGSPLGKDTFDVHFEKAYGEIQGAYPIINREFARYIHEKYPHIQYLNREDDMGIEGLRRAKASYYPDLMVEKYTALAKEGGTL